MEHLFFTLKGCYAVIFYKFIAVHPNRLDT
jgi:hypothetical protein